MSKQELETLTIKLRRPKEYIEAIKQAAKHSGLGSMEEFVNYCIHGYLERYWWPKTVALPTKVYRKLSKLAEKKGISPDELATEIVLENVEKKT